MGRVREMEGEGREKEGKEGVEKLKGRKGK